MSTRLNAELPTGSPAGPTNRCWSPPPAGSRSIYKSWMAGNEGFWIRIPKPSVMLLERGVSGIMHAVVTAAPASKAEINRCCISIIETSRLLVQNVVVLLKYLPASFGQTVTYMFSNYEEPKATCVTS